MAGKNDTARSPDPGASPPSGASGVEAKSPLSLSRLREAFATMLKPQSPEPPRSGPPSREREMETAPPRQQSQQPPVDPCEVSPRSVVEAILFVGRPENRPFSARELAAGMRGVSPDEIDGVVAELNSLYAGDHSPYEIVGSSHGYRLVLREEFGRMRDKLHGRVRETKLSSTALEVLSIVAYNQPTSLEEINDLRGAPSGSILATLVRRKLIRLDRPEERGRKAIYTTTDRFLRLFGLESLGALPRSEELEKG